MQIISKNITDIHPYANNPRKNDQAVDAVASSIREFGFKVPDKAIELQESWQILT